jgi:hypothetical protein
MKMIKAGLAGISLVALIAVTSCNKTNNGGPCRGYVSWALSIQAETTALGLAASAYGQDPSEANCRAYKQAYEDYIDALESQSSCVPGDQRSDFNDSLDDARQELNDLPC